MLRTERDGVVIVGTLDDLVSKYGSMTDFRDGPWITGALAGRMPADKRFKIIIYSDALDRTTAQMGRKACVASDLDEEKPLKGAGFYVRNRELATRILAMPSITQQMLYEMISAMYKTHPDASRIDLEIKWSRIGRKRVLRVFGEKEASYFFLDLI